MRTGEYYFDLEITDQSNSLIRDRLPEMDRDADAPKPIVLCALFIALTYLIMTGVI